MVPVRTMQPSNSQEGSGSNVYHCTQASVAAEHRCRDASCGNGGTGEATLPFHCLSLLFVALDAVNSSDGSCYCCSSFKGQSTTM